MNRHIYTSEITTPKHIHFPYRGLSIDLEGFTGEITAITAWCPKEGDVIDITKEIVGENFAFDGGAYGIAEAMEQINDWLNAYEGRKQFCLDHPVF